MLIEIRKKVPIKTLLYQYTLHYIIKVSVSRGRPSYYSEASSSSILLWFFILVWFVILSAIWGSILTKFSGKLCHFWLFSRYDLIWYRLFPKISRFRGQPLLLGFYEMSMSLPNIFLTIDFLLSMKEQEIFILPTFI